MIALIVGICAFAFMRHNLIVRICVGFGAYFLTNLVLPYLHKLEGVLNHLQSVAKSLS